LPDIAETIVGYHLALDVVLFVIAVLVAVVALFAVVAVVALAALPPILKFATGVVEETANGAKPVGTKLCNWPCA